MHNIPHNIICCLYSHESSIYSGAGAYLTPGQGIRVDKPMDAGQGVVKPLGWAPWVPLGSEGPDSRPCPAWNSPSPTCRGDAQGDASAWVESIAYQRPHVRLRHGWPAAWVAAPVACVAQLLNTLSWVACVAHVACRVAAASMGY